MSNLNAADEFVVAQYNRRWQLVLFSPDTQESRVVARSDRPVRDYRLGSIALTADGTRAALAWDARGSKSGHRIGHLDIVTLTEGQSERTGLTVCSERMAWMPGDRELVVEVLIPMAEALALPGTSEWTPVEERRGSVSGIVAYDPDSGSMRALAAGHAPVLGGDGSCILSQLADGSYALTDVSTGATARVEWPGDHAGPVAIWCATRVLYYGLPTAGRAVISTPHYSPMVGPRELPDIKVADVSTGAFATLLEGVDVRHALSFTHRPWQR
ncbi:MAG TPA: hypothetical protein VFD43_12735 [Planctomycetota bacterium]|nr:hypothetical protein [Planctomycetota bacterium]